MTALSATSYGSNGFFATNSAPQLIDQQEGTTKRQYCQSSFDCIHGHGWPSLEL